MKASNIREVLCFTMTLLLVIATVTARPAYGYDPCNKIDDILACVIYPTGECTWNTYEARCENREMRGRLGASFCPSYDYFLCAHHPSCYWDPIAGRCEVR